MLGKSILAAGAAFAILASAAPAVAATTADQAVGVGPTARVQGPITGGKRGYPYSASIIDLKPYGYTEAEYFVAGVAHAFKPAPGTMLTPDGRWTVAPGDAASYRTRILVRKPPAAKFNGTVVVEFMQEYFGTERDTSFRWNGESLLRHGYGWVGVSLHHEGIDDPSPPHTFTYNGQTLTAGMTLARWDPERYGSLSVPSSDLSYDILSQVGRAIGPNRPKGEVDPFQGLKVRKLIAVGDTVAAQRLAIYINAVQLQAQVFDGFVLKDLSPSDLKLAQGVPTPAARPVRTDTNAPVIVLATTTAVMDLGQQPEGQKLRFWEPAGSSHTTGPYMARVGKANLRDLGQNAESCPVDYANTFPLQYIYAAAIVAVDRWAKTGRPAPSFPQLQVIGGGKDKTTPTDAHGNAVGGIRTPWVDAPIARYDWRGECIGGSGRTFPFSAEQLKALYGAPAAYRRKFDAAATVAERSGVLLPEDAQAAKRAAGAVTW